MDYIIFDRKFLVICIYFPCFRVLANPPEPPKINWSVYKNAVPVPGMVDTFQKQYEALKVPYPADTQTAQVEAQWAEVKKAIDAFIQSSNANITE